MDQFLQFTNELRSFATQHLPPEAVGVAAAVAGALVILGVLVSVLGAKLAKPALTLMFVAWGAAMASGISDRFGDYQGLAIAGGALLGGAVGFLLFRLWVGALAGVFFAALAVGVLAHDRILPALEQWEQTTLTQAQSSAEFVLPAPAQQDQPRRPEIREMAGQVWGHIKAQDAGSPRRLSIIGTLAGAVGFVLAIVAVRLMLIVCSSLVGTAMVLGGALFLSQCYWPQLIDQAATHGRLLTLAGVGFVLTSVLLQSQLTRRVKVVARAPAKS